MTSSVVITPEFNYLLIKLKGTYEKAQENQEEYINVIEEAFREPLKEGLRLGIHEDAVENICQKLGLLFYVGIKNSIYLFDYQESEKERLRLRKSNLR